MKYGLIGEKLGHSLSPKIHAIIFRELGLQNSYELIELSQDEVLTFLATAGKEYGGLNVTIPYKVAVMEGLKAVSREALSIGAVNTIQFKHEAGFGFNTDYFGFGRMLDHSGITLQGKKVVLLGNGGAAKAVLQAAVDRDAAEIVVVARQIEVAKTKLSNFVARVDKLRFVNYETLKRRPQGNVIINATPVGMFPKIDAAPVPPEVVAGYEAAVDIVYNPTETKFLAQAKAAGCATCNGLYMLVAQAVASEEIWLDRKLSDALLEKVAAEMERR